MATLRRAAFITLALLLGWRVLHVNAVVYGEGNRPAVQIPSAGSARLPALAAALDANPAGADALVALVEEKIASGDGAAAARALASALEIAPIDSRVLRTAAVLAVREARIEDAIGRLDQLLTHYPETRSFAFPVMTEWLVHPGANAAIERLAARPSTWMGSFLAHGCGRGDAALQAPILARWAAAGHAGRHEAACVIEGLRRSGRWLPAYQVWLNTLPRARLAEVGYVFNGSFEHDPTGVGFDWIAGAQSPAHAVEYPRTSGVSGERALRVAWSGKRVPGPAISQFAALPPGRYQLSGLARMEGLQSVRGIQWLVRCAQDRAVLGASPRFMGSGGWERFAFDVEVPARCLGQVLQLEAAGFDQGTTYVSGQAWFDDLRLARAD